MNLHSELIRQYDALRLSDSVKLVSITQTLRTAARGIAMLHLTKSGIEGWDVSLPPLHEQRRIAAILDQADALLERRRTALKRLKDLTRSIFVEMFGTLEESDVNWPTRQLGELISGRKLGLVRSSTQLSEHLPYPYIRMNAIDRSGDLNLSQVDRTDATNTEVHENRLRLGDFLFNTRNSRELVGKTALFKDRGTYLFNNNIMRIRFCDEVEPEYVVAAFSRPFVRKSIELMKAGTTSVFAIYWKALATLKIPVPPIRLQREFAGHIMAADAILSVQRAHLAQLTTLFASLQHRAFRGEL